jgi:hypothetical protein
MITYIIVISLITLLFIVDLAIIGFFKLTKKKVVDVNQINNTIHIHKNLFARTYTSLYKLCLCACASAVLLSIPFETDLLRYIAVTMVLVITIYLVSKSISLFLQDKNYSIQKSLSSLVINSQSYQIDQLKYLLVVQTTSSTGSTTYSLYLQFQTSKILLLHGVTQETYEELYKKLVLLLPTTKVMEKSKLFEF